MSTTLTPWSRISSILAITITCTTLLTSVGCANRPPEIIEFSMSNKSFLKQDDAAVAFYKENVDSFKRLMETRKELIGIIVQCPYGYRYSSAKVGTLKNSFLPKYAIQCQPTAVVHTHPTLDGKQNRFSRADLNTSKFYDVYLLSDDMTIRKAHQRKTTTIAKLQ